MIKELLFETTIDDMESNIEIGFPKTKKRQHIVNTINVISVKYLPMIGMKTLRVNGIVNSPNGKYTPTIMFLKVNFENTSTDDNVSLVSATGDKFNITKIDKNNSNIKVRCNCMDYYFRFSVFNFNDNSHILPKPKTYVRKTDSYPPVNPNKVPGVCKHILKLVNYLENTELIN